MATLEVVHTDFCGSSSLSCVSNGSAIPLPGATLTINETSVRGRLGGRIGTTWIANGWRVEPSLTGGVWQTFTGDNFANLTSISPTRIHIGPRVKSAACSISSRYSRACQAS